MTRDCIMYNMGAQLSHMAGGVSAEQASEGVNSCSRLHLSLVGTHFGHTMWTHNPGLPYAVLPGVDIRVAYACIVL